MQVLEIFAVHSDAAKFPWMSVSSLLTIGSETFAISADCDATDRRPEELEKGKRAEEAIRESEARYRRIVETTSEGVWFLDSKFQNSYVNLALEEGTAA